MDQYCKLAKELALNQRTSMRLKILMVPALPLNTNSSASITVVTQIKEQHRELEAAGVQVVMLPVTSFYINEGFVPMSFFREIFVQPALASDFNPGSQPSMWWSFLLHLGMKKMGMNDREILQATCVAPLKALGEKTEDWSLGVGKKCKLNLFEAQSVSNQPIGMAKTCL
ncbi:MAG: hypothetical protein R2877_08195 [Bdellovibrionota bacterium]